uniref:hypothetical protein n=1 Tax=Aeromonas sp. Ne-1 TaxID=1675689 RepID=UPI0015650789|nr:hypothetical protein [Aeromonas sp. Ne-1]
MTNLEKFESINMEVSKLSKEEKVAFLSYLTGAMKTFFRHKQINENRVLEAYSFALECVENESSR